MSEQNGVEEDLGLLAAETVDGALYRHAHGSWRAGDLSLLASEVTRLAALTPRTWDAETIKDAPDNGIPEYRIGVVNRQGEIAGWHVKLLTKSHALELLKAQQDEGFSAAFFGPHPTPPPSKRRMRR